MRTLECGSGEERYNRPGRARAKMGRNAMAAMWVIVVVVLTCQKIGAKEIVSTLGKDNMTVAEVFTEDNFRAFFPHKDDVLAHAIGFYDYESFLAAASMFEKEGFALRGGSNMQKRELAAFFAHVAHETTCGWSGARGGPYTWGLCYKEELSPSSIFCKQDLLYPCVNGASYHGRGAFPIFYNSNYGTVGNALGLNLLLNPEIVANNATVAFATAIWKWMVPQKPNPSPHDVITGQWKPTKLDLDNFRYAGFGVTTNIMNGQIECGHGDDSRGQDRVSHYKIFGTDILGLDDLGDNLDCGLQGMLPVGFTAVLL